MLAFTIQFFCVVDRTYSFNIENLWKDFKPSFSELKSDFLFNEWPLKSATYARKEALPLHQRTSTEEKPSMENNCRNRKGMGG